MIYLDNAATSFPKPRSVIKSVSDCIKKYCGNPSRSSHELSIRAGEAIFDTREKICGLLGVKDVERVVFTLNTTYALNIAIKTTITEKCHVIISDLEHNSVLRPIERLVKDLGVEYSVFNSDAADLENEIATHVRDDTRALISTLCSNVTGREIPLSVLSRVRDKHRIALIVDAAQAAGHTDINLTKTPCDVLCAPGHKALFGIQGCGFAIFCDERVRKSFIEGGSGTDSKSPEMPNLLPERFEAGTLPTPAVASLGEGIRFIERMGISEIKAKISFMSDKFIEMLSFFPGIRVHAASSGIVSFSYKSVPSPVIADELSIRGICTRGGLHCAPMAHAKLKTDGSGLVRISLSALNKRSDVDSAYRALKDMSRFY